MLYFKSILYDNEKLTKFLENNARTTTLFTLTLDTTTAPTLKPQYIRYVQLYGIPDNGIFDSEKLAPIVAEMYKNGLITEEEAYGIAGL